MIDWNEIITVDADAAKVTINRPCYLKYDSSVNGVSFCTLTNDVTDEQVYFYEIPASVLFIVRTKDGHYVKGPIRTVIDYLR